MSTDVASLSGKTKWPRIGRPVAGSSSGSDYEFSLVYNDHNRAVYGLASRLCGPRLAADVTQEVFLRIWRQPERFDPARGTLRSLLLTMTHHMSVDVIRYENALRARERRAGIPDVFLAEQEQDLYVDSQTAAVIAALNRLPAEPRRAIETAFFGDCTYLEAAAVLGIPEGTAKARIRRGMTQLRAELAENI